jgi:hypothetical protein
MAWYRIKRLLFGVNEVPETRGDEGGWSIGNPDARHPYAIAPDHPAANRLFNALEFHATFQLRTPKRILERNGTTIPLTDNPPSDFEPWMGVWFPVDTGPNILAEMAPEAWAEMEANRTVASDAGPVKPAEYLPFLIAFRTIVEDGSATIDERIAKIEALFQQPEWACFVAALQGAERVSGWFFPTVLSRISGLPRLSQAALSESGIRTVAGLRATDDTTLLAINGIGPAKLTAIRQFCDAFYGDPHADRLADIAL